MRGVLQLVQDLARELSQSNIITVLEYRSLFVSIRLVRRLPRRDPPAIAPPNVVPEITTTTQQVQMEPHIVLSQTVGKFYRRRNRRDRTVKIGTRVDPITVVGYIRSVGLWQEVYAETSGTLREWCVKNRQTVEYGQRLCIISE